MLMIAQDLHVLVDHIRLPIHFGTAKVYIFSLLFPAFLKEEPLTTKNPEGFTRLEGNYVGTKDGFVYA